MPATVEETSPKGRIEAKKPAANVPRRLPKAAMRMAHFGFMQRVVTQVAMQLGTSVQPFMKTTPRSKMIAT